MVFYRKYRPQTLDELIGQDNIKQTLFNAFQTGKLAHAYLFCGPKGTGKTSTARILAKMVNCEKASPASTPCNKCPTCLSITDGSNLDFIEIDAASNRGIDDIRDLREKIKLSPSSARKKVYIIDEVHMLSTEAFNALLKTLEEPPEHVLFILATTEVHKIPETILSRVQRLDFKLAHQKDLVQVLQKVVDEEGIKVEKEPLNLIASKAQGSFRDGIKLLDQLASSNSEITVDTVETLLKSGNFENINNLFGALTRHDSKKALHLVLTQIEKGINIKEYTTFALETLQQILFIHYQMGDTVKEEVGSDKFLALMLLAEKFSKTHLIKIISLFEGTLEKLKYSTIPSLPLEIAVVESCQIGDIPEKITGDRGIEDSALKMEDRKIQDNQSFILKELPTIVDHPSSSSPELLILQDKWTYILETVRPNNFSLEAMLKLVKILSCKDSLVTLEVPYSFHQRIIEAPKSKTLLESILSDVLGKSIRVSTVLGQRPTQKDDLVNIEVAKDDEVIQLAAAIFNAE